MSLLFLLLVCGQSIALATASTYDYCNPLLCMGANHVACGATPKQFGKNCSIDAELVPITDKLRSGIVQRFNELRNQLASGGFAGFTPAERMATILWDNDLAYLAEFNVLKCSVHQDVCRNTKKFGHVGQTVSYQGFRKHIPKLETIVVKQINRWFTEHEKSSMNDIFKYMGPDFGKPKENFLQMVVEKNDRIGCAVLKQSSNGWLQTFLTCNYGYAPVVGKAVYESSGEGGSMCDSGTNPTYSHLCSVDEIYNENEKSRLRSMTQIPKTPSIRTTSAEPIATSSMNISPRTANTIKTAPSSLTATSTSFSTDATSERLQHTTLKPAATLKQLMKKVIERKKRLFYRFIHLIENSHLKGKHYQISIITSNHEIDDESKYPKDLNATRNENISMRTKRTRKLRMRTHNIHGRTMPRKNRRTFINGRTRDRQQDLGDGLVKWRTI